MFHLPPAWRKRIIELWGEPGANATKIHHKLVEEGMPVPLRRIRIVGQDAGIDTGKVQKRPTSEPGTATTWSEQRQPVRNMLRRKLSDEQIMRETGCSDRMVRHLRQEFVQELIGQGKTDTQILAATNCTERILRNARRKLADSVK